MQLLYLFPVRLLSDSSIQLNCYNCLYNKISWSANLGLIYLQNNCDEIKINSDGDAMYFCGDGKCRNCNSNVVYDKEYVEDQLQKMKIPQEWLDYNHICSNNEIDDKTFNEWYGNYKKVLVINIKTICYLINIILMCTV